MQPAGDRWLAADAYEGYMGRWSRRLAREFVEWLRPPESANWLEIGCGTGALTSAILNHCEPASIVACDPSAAFVDRAKTDLADPRASFIVAGADALPRRDGGFDLAVSGLVLNFVPNPSEAIASVRDRLRPGGTIAAYVWDYAQGMEFLRVFWDEAVSLDSAAAALDEGRRFPLCAPLGLHTLLSNSGLARVEGVALEIRTEFESFDDYWTPFLRGTGPAPSYVASLDDAGRERLRARIQERVGVERDGHIRLRARAWAARGVSDKD